MEENTISSNSTCEEVAEALFKIFRLIDKDKDFKEKLIGQGISGDILYNLLDFIDSLDLKLGHNKKLKKYLEKNKEKFKPKEIDENISIKNEEEIKTFFEKFIGFKGNLEGIKGENELKQLKEEDMKKLGLNLGQRIKLFRYISYFNSLKDKKEKEIIITITKESSDEDTLIYLKNELNISEKSIDNLGLDTETLFDLTEDDINKSLNKNEIQPEEYEILKKFINKKDEKLKQESLRIRENSSEEEILKFIKEKLNFDIEKQNIKGLNLDQYENISKEEKEILKNFIAKFKRKDEIIEESSDIVYYKKENIEAFKEGSNYNIFFVLSTKNESLKDLRFAVFQRNGTFPFSNSYFNYHFYLINISTYCLKGENYFLLLFQIVSGNPINRFSINVKDFENNFDEPVYQSSEKRIKEGINNFFVLDDDKSTLKYFHEIGIDNYFTEYLGFIFNTKKEKEIKNNSVSP